MRPRDQSKEEAIRQKAVEIIVKDGFDGLSMHKLARAAGVSPATIYIYFRHRDDLILQVGVSEELKMFEASLKGFNPDMSFEEGLRVQWMNRARYFLDNPQQMHFM
ncbi:MAG TPA: TetR/AcrR family transcriptional regulator, partial [Cryomorphaceae bacterium]|nr:TetR/AcrR family transcriptional regulator [Cryomorphaceae bacterium]